MSDTPPLPAAFVPLDFEALPPEVMEERGR
jgi:hypothetical protein